jgi:hypothetical protein
MCVGTDADAIGLIGAPVDEALMMVRDEHGPLRLRQLAHPLLARTIREPVGRIDNLCVRRRPKCTKAPLVKLYHVTYADRVAAIVADGFIDGEGTYMTTELWKGVWLSDWPLDENQGARGDRVVEVEFGDLAPLAEHEWIEENKGYREWHVPAELINTTARGQHLGAIKCPYNICLEAGDRSASRNPTFFPVSWSITSVGHA